MISLEISNPLNKLRTYIEAQRYMGYDPYDTLCSPILRSFTGWPGVIATQIQKRNPINIRPLLGIRKEYNPKAMGLLLHAYVLLQRVFPQEDFSKQQDFLFQWLSKNTSRGFKNTCWGYNFGWAGPGKYLPPFAPTVVATSFIAKGIFEYYQLKKKPEALELLNGVSRFIVEDLPLTETPEGICYSYSPFLKDCCYNASLLGAETLARCYSITGETLLKKNAERAVDFVIHKQKPDGRWNYKIDPETGIERAQVDFHQGYILDSIDAVKKYAGYDSPAVNQAIDKGSGFYMQEQFFPDGRSKWRLPHEYPVEIHNQAQGIITFSRLHKSHNTFLPFAKKILAWTIKHMQDRKQGYFYYRKNRWYTNSISFMRWSNAWMLLAFAEYMIAMNKGGKTNA